MALLTDGYQTLINFSVADISNVLIKEKEIQPPDIDGGGEVDTTTMRNERWRTKQPKHLITLGDCTFQVQYDPSVFVSMVALMINVNQTITVFFPDGSTLSFFGWVDKFTPPVHKEGEFPVAEMKVHCSNQDDDGNESGPVFVEA